MVKDFKCDLKCPSVADFKMGICCENCHRARLYYVNDRNKELWDKTAGFLGEEGCRLSREDMPKECRGYDCKKELHCYIEIKYAPVAWMGQWEAMGGIKGKYIGKLKDLDKLLEVIKAEMESHNKDCGIWISNAT